MEDYKKQIIYSLIREFRLPADTVVCTTVFSSSPNQPFLGMHFQFDHDNHRFNGIFYKGEESANLTYSEIVRQWILDGRLFDEVAMSIDVYKEICKVCNTRDLSKWLRVRLLSGAITERTKGDTSLPFPLCLKVANDNPLKQRKEEVLKTLETSEEHIFDSVRSLTPSLTDAIKVLIDHCSFEGRELEMAIVRGCGGWHNLTEFAISVKTDEGFLIEPTDEYTCEFLKKLYS